MKTGGSSRTAHVTSDSNGPNRALCEKFEVSPARRLCGRRRSDSESNYDDPIGRNRCGLADDCRCRLASLTPVAAAGRHYFRGAGCGFDLPVPGRNYPSPGVRRSPWVSHRLGIQASNPVMFPALLTFPTNAGSGWGQTRRAAWRVAVFGEIY